MRCESIEELKEKYVKLTEKALRIGLLESECIIIGRAIRKLTFEMRKKLLDDAGLLEEGIIYKHVITEGGLLKMVPDKRKMYYERKKKERNVHP